MKLLRSQGQRELSFILGKMLKSTLDPRGRWEGNSREWVVFRVLLQISSVFVPGLLGRTVQSPKK